MAAASHASSRTARGNHYSCSLSALLIARVQAYGGEEGVAEMLRLAGSERTVEYLLDVANWISYDEMLALWRAGAQVTHHPQLSRAVGEDAARRLNASPVAAVLRSLGSPENVYRQVATATTKFSLVAKLDVVGAKPGYAEIVGVSVDGYPRSAEHCGYACGLLTQAPVLFGMPPAVVQHEECQAFGAPRCRYLISWNTEQATAGGDSEHLAGLREQLEGTNERLRSMFETAQDLITVDDLDEVLARITERAAVEVRAPRYLLAVRPQAEGEMRCHHKGFDEGEVEAYAQAILERGLDEHPDSWLVVPVASNRRDYGRLLAMYHTTQRFFPQERELLEVYARYAASALDGATALMEAKRQGEQSGALLKLARALSTAGTSGEVARRLADAVAFVVDCDRVGVYLWDVSRGELVRRALSDKKASEDTGDFSYVPTPGGLLERMVNDPRQEPMFVDAQSGDPLAREAFAKVGAVASMMVPLSAPDTFLGVLAVSVMDRPDRLKANPDLLDRLSGVAAQATTALQNGRLVDEITYQALHDHLTGLANRLQLADQLRSAISRARQRGQSVTLFYIDLDGFKPINEDFGHDVGDKLLIAVGERLAASTRANDMVARLGGDEFAVLIDAQSTPEDAEVVAARLFEAFDESFEIEGNDLRLGASIGRAVYPTDADSADGLLRCADAAMFGVKRGRRETRGDGVAAKN